MNKVYASYLQDKNGKLFALMNRSYTDVVESIVLFMKSDLAAHLDKECDSYQDQDAYKILDDFDSLYIKDVTINPKTADAEAVYWLGYLYRYWVIKESITSKKVISLLPPKKGLEKYLLWHTFSFDKAIELAKEEYVSSKTAHNKYEAKKNIVIDYDDPNIYPFLAKRILYKLTRDQAIDNMVFSQFYTEPTFSNDDQCLYVTKTSFKDMDESVRKEQDHLNYVTKTYQKNVLFIFANGDTCETDINHIISENNAKKMQFTDIYVLNGAKLTHIDDSSSVTETAITITKTDYNISQRLSLRFADE